MREDELRDLLTRYVAPAGATPAPRSVRRKAMGRRALPLAVGAVAVVRGGALVAPQVVTRPAVPAPAASPSASPRASPTVTPNPTPSGTPTPTLSCAEIKDAWYSAITTKAVLPKGLGSSPRLLRHLGGAVAAGGTVNGQFVARVYPQGLDGDSFALPSIGREPNVLIREITDDRVVYGDWSSKPPGYLRVFVFDRATGESWLVVDTRAMDGVPASFFHWQDGDRLRWTMLAPYGSTDNATPTNTSVWEASLTDQAASAHRVLEVGDALPGPLTPSLALSKGEEGVWLAFDRQSLEPGAVPDGMPHPYQVTMFSGDGLVHDRDESDGGEDLWFRDLATGQEKHIYTGNEHPMVTVGGNLAMLTFGSRVTLVDLTSGNSLEVVDDNRVSDAAPIAPSLTSTELLSVDNRVSLGTLPMTIPKC